MFVWNTLFQLGTFFIFLSIFVQLICYCLILLSFVWLRLSASLTNFHRTAVDSCRSNPVFREKIVREDTGCPGHLVPIVLTVLSFRFSGLCLMVVNATIHFHGQASPVGVWSFLSSSSTRRAEKKNRIILVFQLIFHPTSYTKLWQKLANI